MPVDINELWEKAKEELKKEMTPIAFNTWIRNLEIVSSQDNHIVFLSSEYQKDMLENRYGILILNTLEFLTNRTWTFSVVLNNPEETENNEKTNDNIIVSKESKNSNDEDEIDNNYNLYYNYSSLKPEFTFDTFVVGNYNRFAHGAALAVGEAPYDSYNPLYIYGGVGLGKTHLLHAIGNKILKNNKNTKVLYVTAEKFTNQLINALREAKMEVFRKRYREIDVLLIDDIQFIGGKETTQEEFFHTFNALRDNHKQIILSSDVPPKSIQFLEDRLVSRFEGGLLADISNPDYETRLAILRKKAKDENLVIDDFILVDIATKIDSNIRELEGVYKKIVAMSSLTHAPITIELAENIINEFISKKERKISADYIQEVVAKYFSINKEDICGSKRSNDIVYPRHIAMYLCREVANMPFEHIGKAFGNRDHSSIMHGYKKIEKEIKEKDNTRLIVESVKNIIIKGE